MTGCPRCQPAPPPPGAEECRRCGRANPPWAAASPLWNFVMRGGSINGVEEGGGIICAGCFIELAAAKGIAGFRLSATEHPPLETTTPSGRVWDEDRFMWVVPPGAAQEESAHE